MVKKTALNISGKKRNLGLYLQFSFNLSAEWYYGKKFVNRCCIGEVFSEEYIRKKKV